MKYVSFVLLDLSLLGDNICKYKASRYTEHVRTFYEPQVSRAKCFHTQAKFRLWKRSFKYPPQ